MNWLRSTTRWATVPSQTEATMKRTRAVIAPRPGDGCEVELLVAVCARMRAASGMFSLRRMRLKLLLGLFLAKVGVGNYEIRHDEAQKGAYRPRQDDAVEN